MNRKKLVNLQLLRAVAAISVVIFHASGATQKYSPFPSRFSHLFDFGAYGIDLFFVISGFVICYTAKNTPPWEFVKKRLERVVPIYWLYTCLFFIISFAVPSMAGEMSLAKLAVSLGFASFLRADFPIIYVGWTLEYEMCFYGCVALAMVCSRRPWRLTCIVLSLSVCAGAVVTEPSALIKFLSAPIIIEFLLGILIAQVCLERHPGTVDTLFVGLALIAIFFFHHENSRALFAGIPATFMVTLAVFARSLLLPIWIVRLGDASYSIYLVQVFTISACAKVAQKLAPALDPEGMIVVLTLITTGCGLLSYYLIEVPLRNRLSRKAPVMHPSVP